MPELTAGSLRTYFALVASKRVRDSEVNPESSNSHEFNGTKELKEFLGRPPFRRCRRLKCRFLHFSDDRAEPLSAEGDLTWYKSHSNPKRFEWRVYYEDNAVVGKQGKACAGDLMVLAFSPEAAHVPETDRAAPAPEGDTVVWAVIAQAGSVSEREIARLFGLDAQQGEELEFHTPPAEEVDAIGRQLLDGLGIELKLPEDWAATLREKFGDRMPNVAKFSDFAASTLELDFTGDPDVALVSWWEQEDMLFRVHDRALLKKQVQTTIQAADSGEPDVEALRELFMSSTQKARSRAGAAFENQLATILRRNGLRFDVRPKTSAGDIPDFLFPSLDAYETSREVDRLTMLAAKTTCRERWQQVLNEAPRIPRKHLATMSPNIPADQLARMRASQLTLVVPASRHPALGVGADALTLKAFIELVKGRQADG